MTSENQRNDPSAIRKRYSRATSPLRAMAASVAAMAEA